LFIQHRGIGVLRSSHRPGPLPLDFGLAIMSPARKVVSGVSVFETSATWVEDAVEALRLFAG
jgi:hypothetical protein